LRAWYGKPKRSTFDDADIGLMEGEPATRKDVFGDEMLGDEDSGEDDEDEPQILDQEGEEMMSSC